MSEPGAPSPVAVAVAIDGPAGAGKSTVSRALAARLGYFLLDTGALYRSLAWAAQKEAIDWGDEARLAERAHALKVDFGTGSDGKTTVAVDGRDVSAAIRTPEISEGASRVSALPAVRAALLDLQRQIARRGGCVVEGRDIGTVVLPWAPVKFFLTASPEERARRRHAELTARGEPGDLARTLVEINQRDERDATRAAAPLKQADDAVRIDSSALSIDEVVGSMERLVRDRLSALTHLDRQIPVDDEPAAGADPSAAAPSSASSKNPFISLDAPKARR